MRIQFWLKAFIPDQLYTASGEELTFRSKVSELSSKKEDASLLPLLVWFPYLFAAYATDQRTFSSDVHASARITTLIDIPDHRGEKAHINRFSDPTYQVHGRSTEKKISKPRGQQVIEKTENSLHIAFSSAGCNPFFEAYGLAFAPSITMSFDLNLDFQHPTEIKVDLNGSVSQFPAFEAYLKVDENEPACLFKHYPPPGHTPLNLIYGSYPISILSTIRTRPTSVPIAPPPPTLGSVDNSSSESRRPAGRRDLSSQQTLKEDKKEAGITKVRSKL